MSSRDTSGEETMLRQRLKRSRHDRDALSRLVAVLVSRNEFAAAARHVARLCDLSPELPDLYLELARMWLRAEAPTEAVRAARTAVARGAAPLEGQCLLAEAAERAGDAASAIAAYRAAIALSPTAAGLYSNLGLLLRDRGDLHGAMEAFNQACAHAAKHSSGEVSALVNRGNLWRAKGHFENALRDYEQALALAPDHAQTLHNLGLLQLQLGRADEATLTFERAQRISPEHAETSIQLAEALISAGDFARANTEISRVLSAIPRHARAWYLRASLASSPAASVELLAAVTEIRRSPNLTRADHCQLDFATGDLFARLGRHDEAFRAYRAANRFRRDLTSTRERQRAVRLGELMLGTAPARWEAMDDTDNAAHSPVFIIGMPRSGTTLVEQILGAHPDVAPAGEVDYFGPALRWLDIDAHAPAPDDTNPVTASVARLRQLRTGYLARLQTLMPGHQTVITDKTPLNYLYLGMLHSLFPTARFIHCQRHPLDICLSIYFQQFESQHFAHDLGDIAEVFTNYRALMQHWRALPGLDLFDISYESLVENPETQIRNLLEFLGLRWDDACLDAHAQKRTVNSASRLQVRQPIYRHAVMRWPHYEKHLAAVRKRLGL